jgi:dUTP pyrophosphatase
MDFMENAEQMFSKESLELIGTLLVMEDEDFDKVKGSVLDAMREGVSRQENKQLYATLVKQNNFSKEQYIEELKKIDSLVDTEMSDFSETKRDFMKQFFSICYNAIIDSFDVDKRAIQIPIEICNPEAKIPTYAHKGDAGMDVYSTIDVTIAPGETKLIPLGFKVAIPEGYELQVRPRSGFSLRTHLRVANAPGTIDSGYRDEVGIILHNCAPTIQDFGDGRAETCLYGPSYTISKGDRIAQLVLQAVPTALFIKTSDISKIGEDRNGGFGSTGVK